MEWAIEVGEAKGLSSDARTVLVAVAFFANHKHGLAWCSQDEIRAKTNFGHNRVKRAIAELEDSRAVPMKRQRNRTLWGPFPVPPAKLSTRGSTSRPPGVHSGATKVGRIVAACEAYWTPGGPVSRPPGVREPLRSESQNLPASDCATCGGNGRVQDTKKPRGDGLYATVDCPTCRA
jgi:hypothetical protein